MRLHGKALPALIVAVVAVMVLAGCGSAATSSGGAKSSAPAPGAGGGSATGAKVTVQNLAFTPKTLTVKAGTTVTWTNLDPTPHDVTAANSLSLTATPTGTFASGPFNQGQTFSYAFTKPGTYFYECLIHKKLPAMHAEVVVK